MDDFMESIWFPIVVAVIIIAVSLGCIAIITSLTCDAQTANIGMAHHWSIMGGCLIKTPEGTWIPLDNWRYFGQ
jgi:hypothetical protein